MLVPFLQIYNHDLALAVLRLSAVWIRRPHRRKQNPYKQMIIHIVVLGNITSLKDLSELHLFGIGVIDCSTQDPRPESMQAPDS